VFLAGNHPNALMDALVIGVLVPRRVRMLAKGTLFANPVVAALLRGLGVIPLHRAKDAESGAARAERNAAAFREVARALAEDGAVLIFPEGISHDEPQLAPLRTGLARMATDARDEQGVRGQVIVPLGLVFEAKDAPRTRVLLQVGQPIAVDDLPPGTSVATITALLEQRLREVTLNFERADDAARVTALAHTLAVLLAPVRPLGRTEHTLADVVRLTRRITRVQARQGDTVRARVQAFEARFEAFRARLAQERIAIEDLGIDAGIRAGARFVRREVALALLLGPVGLWGRVQHWVPLRLTRWMALRGARTRDEPAMRSVVLGLGLVLGFYGLQAGLVARLAGPWWALAYALTLVPSASSDLRYGDRMRRAHARARAWRRFRRDPALQPSLLAEAAWLQREAGALEQAS
jgi:1-acyl-sn-glycerol-3-phosphate acyltransferase